MKAMTSELNEPVPKCTLNSALGTGWSSRGRAMPGRQAQHALLYKIAVRGEAESNTSSYTHI